MESPNWNRNQAKGRVELFSIESNLFVRNSIPQRLASTCRNIGFFFHWLYSLCMHILSYQSVLIVIVYSCTITSTDTFGPSFPEKIKPISLTPKPVWLNDWIYVWCICVFVFKGLAYTLAAYYYGSKSVTQPDASSKRYVSCYTNRTQNNSDKHCNRQ